MKETEEEHLFKKLGKIPPYSLHGVNIIMNACSKKTHNNFALRGTQIQKNVSVKIIYCESSQIMI